MPIKFAVKIVRLKVYMTIASPMTLTYIKATSASQTGLLLNFYYIQIWHDDPYKHFQSHGQCHQNENVCHA